MATPESPSVATARALERLRQEQVTFDQLHRDASRWFLLRLAVGYASIVLLTAILVVSSTILLNNEKYTTEVVTMAGGALFGDVLGLLVSVWKILLSPESLPKLAPITEYPEELKPAENTG